MKYEIRDATPGNGQTYYADSLRSAREMAREMARTDAVDCLRECLRDEARGGEEAPESMTATHNIWHHGQRIESVDVTVTRAEVARG